MVIEGKGAMIRREDGKSTVSKRLPNPFVVLFAHTWRRTADILCTIKIWPVQILLREKQVLGTSLGIDRNATLLRIANVLCRRRSRYMHYQDRRVYELA